MSPVHLAQMTKAIKVLRVIKWTYSTKGCITRWHINLCDLILTFRFVA